MKTITLIASNTIDHINDYDRGVQIQRSGGPAYYCGNAIKASGFRPILITNNKPTDVFITISNRKEHILIDCVPKIRLPERLPSRNIILSPILGEFDLRNLRSRRCVVFLDAQGYIRSPRGNADQNWHCEISDLNNVIALKVNQREFSRVDKSIIEAFKQRILLLTRGADGVELWDHGQRINISARKVNSVDTLGAGDTFFGSFVVKFLKKRNAEVAARFAVFKAEQLLKEKGCNQ